MTCIVAIVKDKKIYMAGDSAGTVSGYTKSYKGHKIFKKEELIFGYTSSFRFGQLLQYNLDIPYHAPKDSIDKYIRVDLCDAIRKCLKNGGYTTIDNNEEKGGECLIGYKGRLFCMQSDFSINEHIEPYSACGYKQSALTALEILHKEKEPKEALLETLRVVSKFGTGVREPFYVETL